MKIETYDFQYNPKNLDKINIDLLKGNFDMSIIVLMVIIFLIWLSVYLIAPYIKWYLLVRSYNKRKIENKLKIKELILMKEVQTELEKEIEESLLNAWLKMSQAT